MTSEESTLTEADIAQINYKIYSYRNVINGLVNTVSKLNDAKSNLNNINSIVKKYYKLNNTCMDNGYGENTIEDIANIILYINNTVIPNLKYEISKLESELS